MEAPQRSKKGNEGGGAGKENDGCALNGEMYESNNQDSHSCTALVPYRERLELSWEADSTWSVRMKSVSMFSYLAIYPHGPYVRFNLSAHTQEFAHDEADDRRC